MDERSHHRLYVAQSLLLGLPALLAGGGAAGFFIYLFLSKASPGGDGELLALCIAAAFGLAGCMGWSWLSWLYLRRGRDGLRQAPLLLWVALLLGSLATLFPLGLVLYALLNGSPWQVLGYLLLGPPLLLPAAHLVWLRRGQTLAAQG